MCAYAVKNSTIPRAIFSYMALLRVHPSRRAWISSSPEMWTSLNVFMSFQMAAIAFCTKSSKDVSDEGTRCKIFSASTAQFGSLAFTLLKKALPCCAVPCRAVSAHFRKACQPVRHGTARHAFTLAKKAVPCWPTFFLPV